MESTTCMGAKADLWTKPQVRMEEATQRALGSFYFLHSQRSFQVLTETSVP